MAQQIGKRELCVLPTAAIGQMLSDQFSEPESLVEFAHQDQAAIGGDARTLEIDLERGVERELKRLAWAFTHWVPDLWGVVIAFTPA